MPNAPTISDYRKDFSQHVTSARTFIVRSIIVLTLLIVVVEDRLSDLRNKVARAEEELRAVDTSLGMAVSLVREHRQAVVDRLSDLSVIRRVGRSILSPPSGPRTPRALALSPADAIRREAGRLRLAESREELGFLASEVERKDVAAARRRALDFANPVLLKLPPQLRPQRESDEMGGDFAASLAVLPDEWEGPEESQRLASLREVAAELRTLARAEERTRAGSNQRLRTVSEMHVLARDIEVYEREYRAQTRRWRTLNAEKNRKQAEMVEIQTRASSIPTPFGGFNVLPGLALVGLVFATFACYVSMLAHVGRLHTLGHRFVADHGAAEVLSISGPAPSWLWSRERALDHVFAWPPTKRRPLFAMLFHSAWLAALGVLVYQAWSAAGNVLFLDSRATKLAIAATLPIALVLMLGLVAAVAPPSIAVASPGRRRFIGFGLSLTTAAVFGVLTLWRRTSEPQPPSNAITGAQAKGFFGEEDFDKAFILNVRTRVIHEAAESHAHRPTTMAVAKDVSDRELKQCWLHRGSALVDRRARATLASVVNGNSEPATHALEMLKAAMLASPLSVHIFDRYVSACGRFRRYDEIVPMLDRVKEAMDRLVQVAHLAPTRRDKAWGQYQQRILGLERRERRAQARRQKGAGKSGH